MDKKRIDKIVWWIPNRKLRNIIRNGMLYSNGSNTHENESNVYGFVFDRHIDNILMGIGKTARKRLEEIPKEKRKKIVYFLCYHHSKLRALIDAIHIIALQLRGVEIFAVRSSYFYDKEDVIFGGVYNINRFEQHYEMSRSKGLLLSNLLQVKTIDLGAFLDKEEIIFANNFSEEIDPKDWEKIEYDKQEIGKMAYFIVANMNNIPQMEYTEKHIEQFRAHIRNCILLSISSKKLLHAIKPDSIISNHPFYYQWRIPVINAMSLGIKAYSFHLSERLNSVFFGLNAFKMFDHANSWDSFNNSNLYDDYKDIVEKAINDRFEGKGIAYDYLPSANNLNEKFYKIKELVKDKPTLLLACNILTDASVLTQTKAFNSCFEMVKYIIDWFRIHPEYNCILKAHPAEKIFHSNDIDLIYLRASLKKERIELPENVFFIDSTDEISVYSLFPFIKGIAAYSSSVCIDAAFYGIASVCANESSFSEIGFSITANTKENYEEVMHKLLNDDFDKSKEEIMKIVRKYYLLYHFIGQTKYYLFNGDEEGWTPLEIFFDSVEHFLPGNNKQLDYVCDAIIYGKPIFDENRWPPISL